MGSCNCFHFCKREFRKYIDPNIKCNIYWSSVFGISLPRLVFNKIIMEYTFWFLESTCSDRILIKKNKKTKKAKLRLSSRDWGETVASWIDRSLEVGQLSVSPCRRGKALSRPLHSPFTDGYAVVFEQRLTDSPLNQMVAIRFAWLMGDVEASGPIYRMRRMWVPQILRTCKV